MEYENQRLKRIEENKQKMLELGIKAHAYEAKSLKGQKKQKINKKKSKEVLARDIEYVLDEGCELDLSSEENDKEGDDNEFMQNILSLRSHSKKVIASRGENLVKSSTKPKCSTISMSSMLKMQSQTCKDREQQRNEKSLQKKVPTLVDEQGNSNKRVPKSQQRVSMVAPGSLNAYVMMREKSKERTSSQIYASREDPIQVRADSSPYHQMENSQKRSAGLSSNNLLHGLVDEDEDSESSDDDIFENEKEKAGDPTEIENDLAMLNPIEDHLIDQPVLQKQKRKRGPSMCKDVHGRSMHDRKPVILNELGQPIGPSSSTLNEFSRFLGSLARNSTLAPLNKPYWHQVPNKDQIWEYVKTKYMIAEEGKNYVLHSIGVLWRNYKCRIKKKHYKAYDNMKDRWNNRPTSISKLHFRELLKYWSLKKVQDISEKNQEISKCQIDRHTAGPVSFARKRHELEQATNIPPSEAAMFTETRKRKPERKYKTSNVMEEVQIQEQRILSGRCTKRVKASSKSTMLIPDEFLQPYKANIVKETVSEVMKVLQQVLPSDMLAHIAPSITDQSNNLVGGRSSSDINDPDQCQNDGDRDAEGDDQDDLEDIQDE